MDCPRCDFANPEDMRFCGACGAELARRCPECDAGNPSGFRFCGNCGADIQATKATGPAKAAAAQQQPATRVDAERRQISVLFCDLLGSTALAEALDPEDLRLVVTEYHSVCDAVTKRFGGYLAQFLGDGVLVYFGYPRAREDDGGHAVRAALEIQSELRNLNDRLRARGLPAVHARVGIHTGPVVVGQGSGQNRETQATGDTMNIAARLESIAEPDSIVISETTLRLVAGQFVTRDLGRPSLKGYAPRLGPTR